MDSFPLLFCLAGCTMLTTSLPQGELRGVGTISSGATYLYHLNDRSSLTSLQTSRYRHAALVFQEKNSYGGTDGRSDLHTAEKLNVKKHSIHREEQGVNLPSSQRRKDFTLCCDLQHIYLCGATGFEQFTPQTSTYLPMILSLPCATCYNAVLLGKELLVLADSEVIYLQLPLGKAPKRVQEIGSKRTLSCQCNGSGAESVLVRR